MTRLIWFIAVLALSGCANHTLRITFASDPSGAALYKGQQEFCYTPCTFNYPVSQEDMKLGYLKLTGPSVRWTSGAKVEAVSMEVDINRHGLEQIFTFQRPNEVAGREADVQVSLELERRREAAKQKYLRDAAEQVRVRENEERLRESMHQAMRENDRILRDLSR